MCYTRESVLSPIRVFFWGKMDVCGYARSDCIMEIHTVTILCCLLSNAAGQPSSPGASRGSGLDAEASEVLMKGMSSLETLLKRLATGDVSVAHTRLAHQHRAQLLLLCEEMDKACRKAADAKTAASSHAKNVESQLAACLRLIEELEEKQARLQCIFSLCHYGNINISKDCFDSRYKIKYTTKKELMHSRT